MSSEAERKDAAGWVGDAVEELQKLSDDIADGTVTTRKEIEDAISDIEYTVSNVFGILGLE